MANQVGIALGEALSNIGRQYGENAEWDRRRKLEQEAAVKDLQNRMKMQQDAAVQEARLKPPAERKTARLDETGKQVNEYERWELNPEGTGGSWVKDRNEPVMMAKLPSIRTYPKDGRKITEELQPDGSVREIASSPQFRERSGSGSSRAPAPKVKYEKAPHPDDPKRWVGIIMRDGKSEYVTDAKGEFVDVAPPYRERKGANGEEPSFLSKVGDSLNRAVTNLSKSARQFSERESSSGSKPASQTNQISAEDQQLLESAMRAINDPSNPRDPNAVRRRLIENGKAYLADKI